MLVEERRVAHHDLPLPARRSVAVDEAEFEPGQALRELDRVRDRRRREHEARGRAVGGRKPAQPPQHVGDVRSEDAAVDVSFVDDDEREVGEEVSPAVVVRKDPDMQHVGVRQDQVRARADRGTLRLRRVAVVDRVPQGGDLELREATRLVLGESLGRI